MDFFINGDILNRKTKRQLRSTYTSFPKLKGLYFKTNWNYRMIDMWNNPIYNHFNSKEDIGVYVPGKIILD